MSLSFCCVAAPAIGRGGGGRERISSVSNPFVKHCVKLRLSSSYRRSYGSAIVVGLTPILEICTRFHELKLSSSSSSSSSILDCLVMLDGSEVPKEIRDSSTSLVYVSSVVMKKLSGMQSIDSIVAIAVINIPATFTKDNKHEEAQIWSTSPPHRILALDGIQDPGNLGTLLRSAMAFKWDGIFLLHGCCDPFNEKALRAARGASFQLPVVSGDWSDLENLRTEFQLKMLAGHPGVHGSSKPVISLSQGLADSLVSTPLCLVLGSEGHGLSEQTLRACELVSIPMSGMFESLNVSVAGGIFLFMLQPECNHFRC